MADKFKIIPMTSPICEVVQPNDKKLAVAFIVGGYIEEFNKGLLLFQVKSATIVNNYAYCVRWK